MNIFILIALFAVNAIAFLIIYQFIKNLPTKEKLIFFAVSIAIHYMIISVIYTISSWVTGAQLSQQAGDTIIFAFVPVNAILTIPFIANSYQKLKLKKLKQDKFKNRIILTIALFIFVLIGEYFYFGTYQTDIMEKEKMEKHNANTQNTITNEIGNQTSNTITNIQNSNVQGNAITNSLGNSQNTF